MANTKAYKGLAMEGPIAAWYTKITSKDLHRHKFMAASLAPRIPAGGRVLEIAPGPGFFCIELAKLGNFQISGLDISKSFVEIARKNAAQAGLKIDFREGNASAMPFEDASFDFTFCQAAFKNFSQPVKAIAEMYRVLKPGGTAVIVDMRNDATAEEIEREVKGMHLDRVNETFTRLTFTQGLIKSAYSIPQMEAMIAQTPFGKGQIDVGGVGFQVWLKKIG
ncbi:MAG: class I SAM-dependent methyltransferase [Anaerolineaceae bacterium]|nr:class I SAM-dependent methyltransferase [Anaerolineaceae bacterium]